MRVAAVIPAFNEAPFVGEVVRRVRPLVEQVFVIDDGSTDDTAQRAEAAGAVVLRNSRNLGKGASLKRGFQAASGFDAVVTIDGDLQHDPDDLKVMLEVFVRDQADLVIGARPRSPNMPPVRRLVNALSDVLLSLVTGRRLRDVHSGFRLIRTSALRRLPLRLERFDAELELLIRACRRGLRIRETTTRTIYADEVSSIHPILDTVRFFRVVSWALFGLI